MTDGDWPDEEDAITPVIKAHVDVILIHGQDLALGGHLAGAEGVERIRVDVEGGCKWWRQM